MTGPETIFGLKIATLVSSGVASVISVALEYRNHDVITAVGAVVAGVFVATVATDLTLEFFQLSNASGTWNHAIAAAYGITGRNLILWLRRVANDPPEVIRSFFGLGKGGDK